MAMRLDLDISSRVGAVVIGRNEGERLIRCLVSLTNQLNHIVYVDSGSTDNSVEAVLALGIDVVKLDLNLPFTAARARNEGFNRLIEASPKIEYVQFVDGDCEVIVTWLKDSVSFLDSNYQYAVVCGRRRERYPEHSIFNLMCDIEWDTPIGDAKACGGDAMMRIKAFLETGGYRDQLIAGEEPELCVRLRKCGWKVWRLNSEMTLHDAAITKFGQWWRRNVRSGYAFAEGSYLHGAPPEWHWVIESRRSFIWALFIPAFVLLAGVISWQYAMITALIYPLQIGRLALKNKQESKPHPLEIAGFSVLGKFAEIYGQLRFYYLRLFSKPAQLIEYK
jgi:glycosyltransferase involved in cell wall biosynthesis